MQQIQQIHNQNQPICNRIKRDILDLRFIFYRRANLFVYSACSKPRIKNDVIVRYCITQILHRIDDPLRQHGLRIALLLYSYLFCNHASA